MGKIFDYDGVPVLHTTSGDLKGYFYDGVYIYKGIPYAYADRFQMPVPSKWDGVKDATNYGFVCPLQNQDTPNGELMVPHRYWPQDEHCQSLNIWTNKLDPEAKKPVLVWFHGGGYAAGSSIEQVAYDGVSIAKKGDSILVSVNHRLNILGYLDLSPFGEKYKNSANAGHADMVAALQWVHDNIAAFGGDPENVTIFGQSGGGMKVATLMNTPAADGLFQKGIIESGVYEAKVYQKEDGDGTAIVKALLKELNLDESRWRSLRRSRIMSCQMRTIKLRQRLLRKAAISDRDRWRTAGSAEIRSNADLRITPKRFRCWQEPTSVSLILDRLCRENMR